MALLPSIKEEESSAQSDTSEDLLLEDAENGEPISRHQRRKSKTTLYRYYLTSRGLLCLAILFVLTFLIGVAASIPPSHLSSSSFNAFTSSSFLETPSSPHPCGTNWTTAEAAGCVFDIMAFAWLPPACYDPALDRKYVDRSQAGGELRWFEDLNGTVPVANDIDALKRYPSLFVEHRYHYQHCLYTMELVHRAATRGTPLYDYLVKYEHPLHCLDLIKGFREEPEPGDDFVRGEGVWLDTLVRTRFSGCGL